MLLWVESSARTLLPGRRLAALGRIPGLGTWSPPAPSLPPVRTELTRVHMKTHIHRPRHGHTHTHTHYHKNLMCPLWSSITWCLNGDPQTALPRAQWALGRGQRGLRLACDPSLTPPPQETRLAAIRSAKPTKHEGRPGTLTAPPEATLGGPDTSRSPANHTMASGDLERTVQ